VIGGGRIVGEACHFIDLLQFLIGAAPIRVNASAVETEHGIIDDEVIININFADGSLSTIIYAAGVIGDNRIAILDDYRDLELVQAGKRQRYKERLRPNKGHREEWKAFVHAILNGLPTPVSIKEIVLSHLATFAALESLRQGSTVRLDAVEFWEKVLRNEQNT
jgi:predicted dehydrogenase